MTAYYSFAGVPFGPRQVDLVPQVDPPALLLSERQVPYSDYTIIDKGGFGPRRYKSQIRVAPLYEGAFYGLLGHVYPLVVAGVTWPAAFLAKLDNHLMSPYGEWHFYEAEWTMVTSGIG